MRLKSRNVVLGLALGGALAAPTLAQADDVHARVAVGPGGRAHVAVVDRFHRVPPDIRAHGWRGHFAVRANPFRTHLGWRVGRFTPRERAMWTHGRWWHGRWNGHFGWWWGVNGGWFFYTAPVYPYPDYVSETLYDQAPQDSADYWYYCRDPEGYYPYVRRCYGQWEPVPAQPTAGPGNGPGPDGGPDQYGPGPGGGPDQYGPGPGGGPDQYGPGPGPDQDQMGPDDQGPPDQGPPGGYGNDQGPPGGYGNDQGPPDDQGPPPDDQGPPDQGPPPR